MTALTPELHPPNGDRAAAYRAMQSTYDDGFAAGRAAWERGDDQPDTETLPGLDPWWTAWWRGAADGYALGWVGGRTDES